MDSVNEKGDSPLSLAAAHGSKDLVQFLLNYKAKVNHRNSQGLTPIFQASMNRSELTVFFTTTRYFPRQAPNNLNLRFLWSF